MPSVYSVYGSKLHLLLPDDFAAAVNRAQNALIRSVENQQGLIVQWTTTERNAWNEYAELMNQLIKINGDKLDLDVDANMYDGDILFKVL